jgi:hypothetical protein
MSPVDLAIGYVADAQDHAQRLKDISLDAQTALKQGDLSLAAELLEQAKQPLQDIHRRIDDARFYITKALEIKPCTT